MFAKMEEGIFWFGNNLVSGGNTDDNFWNQLRNMYTQRAKRIALRRINSLFFRENFASLSTKSACKRT